MNATFRPCRALVFVTCAFLLAACASTLPSSGSPEEVGLSSAKLAELKAALQRDVDRGEIAGAVVLVGRHGKIGYFEPVGFRDREAKVPMTRDSIFRIASMTKPIVTVGAMMLVEEGKLDPAAPVARYLPEFKDVQVGVESKDANGHMVMSREAPRRAMTVQDLMQHTSGLTYGIFGKSAVKDLYNKANLFDPGQTNAQFVAKIAKLPLQNQPGEKWEYSMSVDVLGRVIEVVSGQDLETYLKGRVLKPLGMNETGFWIDDPEQKMRLAEPAIDGSTGKRPVMVQSTKRQAWASGGGGMVSTAMDYARFCQFLLNKGELDGVRLISRETFAAMLTPRVKAADQEFGWGFMIRVNEKGELPGAVGDLGWAGFYGTYFWVDPKHDLYAVLMAQLRPNIRNHYRKLMRDNLYSMPLN
ncbi:MAG: serine hydrolase domain-containing protein [Acidobacteriota bacterium]